LLPDANLHAPNEWLRLQDFYRARTVYAAFLSGWQGGAMSTGGV
jgi:acetylornithine deacetylase/succinyl-diaminopimelate desuccinylase-like protein